MKEGTRRGVDSYSYPRLRGSKGIGVKAILNTSVLLRNVS